MILIYVYILISYFINTNVYKDEKLLIGPMLFALVYISIPNENIDYIIGMLVWYLFDILYNIYIFIKEHK